ncbi:glutathione S-transferase T3-like [Eutrema salsugineum]|uniref:glutathione S-transferase T3-like n=1 Tax=Eutrema salsugineum TaxID=72664 RepID=UPI000CED4285|nr:glutathione S-transferase T3-like [Eutrema salsugineum]
MEYSSQIPFSPNTNFVDLLNSQQDGVFCGYASSLGEEMPAVVEASAEEQKAKRKTWSPADDVLLISSWLNTSKDSIVGNEQRAGSFWKRISVFYAASSKSSDHPDAIQCKQRWQKINDLVCKFVGAYESATREKTSGQNENDILKAAHEIFFNLHKKRFTLEHAWKELRWDQKWITHSSSKAEGTNKRKKRVDGSQSPTGMADEQTASDAENKSKRPIGVKAAKAKAKKTIMDMKAVLEDFRTMADVKAKDLAEKKAISKMAVLERLLAKPEPLSDTEEAFKLKLIADLME